jgi:hypothetical protein
LSGRSSRIFPLRIVVENAKFIFISNNLSRRSFSLCAFLQHAMVRAARCAGAMGAAATSTGTIGVTSSLFMLFCRRHSGAPRTRRHPSFGLMLATSRACGIFFRALRLCNAEPNARKGGTSVRFMHDIVVSQ